MHTHKRTFLYTPFIFVYIVNYNLSLFRYHSLKDYINIQVYSHSKSFFIFKTFLLLFFYFYITSYHINLLSQTLLQL